MDMMQGYHASKCDWFIVTTVNSQSRTIVIKKGPKAVDTVDVSSLLVKLCVANHIVLDLWTSHLTLIINVLEQNTRHFQAFCVPKQIQCLQRFDFFFRIGS